MPAKANRLGQMHLHVNTLLQVSPDRAKDGQITTAMAMGSSEYPTITQMSPGGGPVNPTDAIAVSHVD
jgi:hypothetical protein